YYGVYRMWEWLVKDKGYKVNIKRVRHLCRLMGLEAIGPKPNTSKPPPPITLPINLLQLRIILQRNAPTHRLQLLLKHRAFSPLTPAPVIRCNKFL
ncbi:transposase, partial [Chlorobium phaeovibrioides]